MFCTRRWKLALRLVVLCSALVVPTTNGQQKRSVPPDPVFGPSLGGLSLEHLAEWASSATNPLWSSMNRSARRLVSWAKQAQTQAARSIDVDLPWMDSLRGPERPSKRQPLITPKGDRSSAGSRARRPEHLVWVDGVLWDENTLPAPLMIKMEGYPVESHQVLTKDGYTLTMHRIPFGRGHESLSPASSSRTPRSSTSVFGNNSEIYGDGVPLRIPVLVQHGVLCSSADWVMGAPERSLGFMLADAGYDVWLGNFRGNTYSRNHMNSSRDLHMHPDNVPFWDFSFDEMGRYDLPAMIKHVQRVSGQQKIFYVGHSMGTTTMWIMANHFPEFATNSIRSMVALAPVATLSNMASPLLRLMAPISNQLERAFRMLGQHEFWSPRSFQFDIARKMCPKLDKKSRCEVPENVIFLLCGFDKPQMNMTLLPKILGHTPSGTSLKTILHYVQIFKSKRFQAFDGGVNYNFHHYGSPGPRQYTLSRVQFPVAVFYGRNDWITVPKDVETLAKSLPNLVLHKEVPFEKFNHLDFMWAKDANTLLYKDIIKFLRGS